MGNVHSLKMSANSLPICKNWTWWLFDLKWMTVICIVQRRIWTSWRCAYMTELMQNYKFPGSSWENIRVWSLRWLIQHFSPDSSSFVTCPQSFLVSMLHSFGFWKLLSSAVFSARQTKSVPSPGDALLHGRDEFPFSLAITPAQKWERERMWEFWGMGKVAERMTTETSDLWVLGKKTKIIYHRQNCLLLEYSVGT